MGPTPLTAANPTTKLKHANEMPDRLLENERNAFVRFM